jgi:hypothetical protein
VEIDVQAVVAALAGGESVPEQAARLGVGVATINRRLRTAERPSLTVHAAAVVGPDMGRLAQRGLWGGVEPVKRSAGRSGCFNFWPAAAIDRALMIRRWRDRGYSYDEIAGAMVSTPAGRVLPAP